MKYHYLSLISSQLPQPTQPSCISLYLFVDFSFEGQGRVAGLLLGYRPLGR